MSMCKLHSEFYRQQAKLDAMLTRRCHTITEGKNGEGATYIKTARGWLHIAHGVVMGNHSLEQNRLMAFHIF